MKIFSGSSYRELAGDIAKELLCDLAPLKIKRFANGELYVRSMVSVRGENTYLVQSFPSGKINELLVETLLIIDAFKRASANTINLILPIFPYSRQDKKHLGREALSAKLIASLFERAGSDRVITIDLHSGQLQGFFDIPLDHLSVGRQLIPFLKDITSLDNCILVAPDAGRANLIGEWGKRLGIPLAVVHKKRDLHVSNSTESFGVIGDVKGKKCILVDDMIDTGSTIIGAHNLLKAIGAASVGVIIIHPIFSTKAIEAIDSLDLDFLVTSNTLPVPEFKKTNSRIFSVAPLIGKAISAVETNGSITELFTL